MGNQGHIYGAPLLVARSDLKLFAQGPRCHDFVPAARALARAVNSQVKAPKLEKPKVGRAKKEGVTKRKKSDPPKHGSARPDYVRQNSIYFSMMQATHATSSAKPLRKRKSFLVSRKKRADEQ